MQNYCKTIGAMAAVSALVAGTALAEVEYEIHAGYSSEYIFRGLDFGDDLVEAGVDVAADFNGLGLSAGAWYGSFNRNVAGGNVTLDELDVYGQVSKDLGFATASVGYIYYMRDNNFLLDDAQEAYFSLGREFFGFETSLTYFWDIETDNDGYLELAVGKGYELSPCLTLNTGVTLAYLTEETEFAHVTAKVSLDWAFTETATLSPFVAASWGLNNDIGNTHSNASEELAVGTLLSVSF